jgi:hypothetical protein
MILCPHCERGIDGPHDLDACRRKRMSRRSFFGTLLGAAVAPIAAKALPRRTTGGLFDPHADVHAQYELARRVIMPGLIEYQRAYNRWLSMQTETIQSAGSSR